MNTNELDDLLRSASENPPLPTSFRREVWARIADAEQRSFAAWLGRMLIAFTRPVPAVASVIVTVLIGAWLGLATAPPVKDAQLSYAESISPFLQEDVP